MYVIFLNALNCALHYLYLNVELFEPIDVQFVYSTVVNSSSILVESTLASKVNIFTAHCASIITEDIEFCINNLNRKFMHCIESRVYVT